jgi:opacity protein-like surface antigen
MKKILVLAVLAVAFIATPAMAKQGFYLGGYIPFTSVSGDSLDAFDDTYFGSLDGGAGLGLRLGIGFNRYVALEGSFFRSIHSTDMIIGGYQIEDQEFTGQTLDLKINFPLTGSNIEPYLLIGVGAYQFGDSGGTYYEGSGNQFGVGLDMYMAPELSMNVGLTWRKITIDSGDFHNVYDSNVDTSTFDVGLTYHFL